VHVLFVSQYFTPEIGATQTRIHEFARAFAARGHRVTVLTEFPNHPHGRIPESYHGKVFTHEDMDGFVVERVWVKASQVKNFRTRLLFYLSFLALATGRGLTLRGPVDVVFATSPPLPVGLAGWLVAVRHRARFILDVRDLWPGAAEALGELRSPPLLRMASWLEAFLYARADRISAVTNSFVRDIARRVRHAEKVLHLPNGASTDVFDPARADLAIRRAVAPTGGFVVTFAGLLGIAQGLSTVLDAADLLRDRRDVRILLIGDGPAKARLRHVAEERGLDNVGFLDAMPAASVTSYLVASDALLVPLGAEPIFRLFVPSKLFDFLACARPVILMVDGEAREILEAASGGVFAPPGDATALAQAIRALAALSASERDAMGARGRAYVLANYTRAEQSRRLIALAESMTSR